MEKNRVFDLDAGFLDDELLAAQMRLLVGLVGTDRGRSAGDRMPAGWQGHEDALTLRLNQLMGEMTLRGQAVPGQVAVTGEAILWPPLDPVALAEETRFITARAEAGHRGRIRMPRNDHELWATYKYSLLARNRQAYHSFGRRVAARAVPLDALWLALVNASRVTPPEGGIRNALQHMWGYVSDHSGLSPQVDDLDALAADVQQLALQHEVSYLLNSTALGELRAWL
ncbi:hypothetical protein EZI54_16165 [Marinobacter halodurans]|uniref:DUF1722 domain-containing protein n=1 Tax=Marinobacter halodurans TaxID=2528979 RepID=A0ABY1ZH20_9GAMM|nr:hypothetical protein [Marinobacter halodurans]TBW52175.1 hypothetical protein EZI54_16165 [Marinobacter halodurans]